MATDQKKTNNNKRWHVWGTEARGAPKLVHACAAQRHRGTGCTQVSTEATANEHQPAGPCVVLRQNGVSAVSGSSLGLQTSL